MSSPCTTHYTTWPHPCPPLTSFTPTASLQNHKNFATPHQDILVPFDISIADVSFRVEKLNTNSKKARQMVYKMQHANCPSSAAHLLVTEVHPVVLPAVACCRGSPPALSTPLGEGLYVAR